MLCYDISKYLHGTPANHTSYLTWKVNANLPTGTIWAISNESTPGDKESPITEIPEATRSYSLTGLTYSEWHSVTLSIEPALLSDNVSLMTTANLSYLPIVMM